MPHCILPRSRSCVAIAGFLEIEAIAFGILPDSKPHLTAEESRDDGI